MPTPNRPGRRGVPTIVLATAALLTTTLLTTTLPTGAAAAPAAGPAAAPDPSGKPAQYVVTLAERPLASYTGGTAGIPRTKPLTGRRLDAGSSAARRYQSHLEQAQDTVAERVGATPEQRYAVALNGFTASLTPEQARTLARSRDVLSVVKDVPRRLTDDRNSVDFLGLPGRKGVWADLGGTKRAGRGVVIGVLDTGIWPESASFAGDPLEPKPARVKVGQPYSSLDQIHMLKSDGGLFIGACEAGETSADDFTGDECNTKVISARTFDDGYKLAVPADERADYLSPRDGNGHGSHTASTAAGDTDVPASVGGRSFGTISGVAPAAKIAVYKVCYSSKSDTEGGCYTSDSLTAIEQAVLDGVDVINFSIGGSDDVLDPVDLAFFSAASAGVFVAASAGNSGPDPSTIEHVVPWVTTVAASTVAPRAGTVVLGNGQKYVGSSTTVAQTVGPAPLVAAAAAKTAGASAADASLCQADTLDPALSAGTIVVCTRGGNARVDKSAEVKRAGGVGMVLVNPSANSTDGDTHAVPTVHLDVAAGEPVLAYAKTSGATASLVDGNQTKTRLPYPQVAGFSSRGPSLGNEGDLLKPDVSAPGVGILAAVAPPSNQGRSFDFYSGTSMASPHVAGAAALYLGKRPTWSPMAVKSALMTTAGPTLTSDGSREKDLYAQGAGNIRPGRSLSPGVVFDSSDRDWLAFLAGAGVSGTGVAAVDPSDYNSPSIAIGKLVGSQTVTRRVTAVDAGRYRVRVSVPGVKSSVRPSVLTFSRRGQVKTIKVTFRTRTAPLAEAAFGSLTLTGRGHEAKVPIAVTPRAIDAPASVSGAVADGSLSFDVTPGFTGTLPVTIAGLAAARSASGDVKTTDAPVRYPTQVPSGTRFARFRADAASSAADIDLLVYRVVDGKDTLVATSATPSGSEEVLLADPEPGDYVAVVTPYADAPGESSTAYTVQTVSIGPDVGNLTVSPAPATVRSGEATTLTARWTGLTTGTSYAGWLGYPDGTGTFIDVG